MKGMPQDPDESSSPERLWIALLEDDLLTAHVIEQALTGKGWSCRQFQTVEAISIALRTQSFDLLILDWCLPDGEADSVISLARNELAMTTPILIESVNDDEQRIVGALALGADDYVVKPLRISELQARVAALLRRSRQLDLGALEFGLYRFDMPNRKLFLDGEDLLLSAIEFELSRYFFVHIGELLSRERLLSKVWNRNADVDTRTVDAHVSRLRRKLRLNEDAGFAISTLRGYGYRLESAA
jgi:DNA-binding response OmpR family regulator